MLEVFIRRPVLATVISIVITLLGLLSLVSMPVTQFPSIEPPSVTVTAQYTGANADVCAKAVATPLERAINGVPRMTYMSTVCSNNGITLIQIFFESGSDPDLVTVNVQNRVTSVMDELPEEVIKAGVIVEKEVSSMLMYLNITTDDTTLDEKFVYNFTDINVLQELKRISGVGFVEIMGARDYAMRIWLKPDRMAAFNLSTEEIIEAIRNQNIEAAPGSTGISSDRKPQLLQYILKYRGKFNTEPEYLNMVVKTGEDGSMVRIRDIADVEFGSLEYNMISMTDGKPSASIMVKQRPGSNAREVIANIKSKMSELKSTTFPPGMSYSIDYDVSRFLDASVHEVVRTLIEAFVLVSIVVFIFLQDFRSTIIPAIAVPVSLIGTFFFMDMFGFSINMLTLFALVLAIGIVVDNAIVVVEAVHVKMHLLKVDAPTATLAAMREIAGAVVSITLVMSAVFIPVGFMSGPIGVFYRQFSLTLAIAIVISGINALTLSPALCALLLRPVSNHTSDSFFQKCFTGFNNAYKTLEGNYGRMLSYTATRRLLTITVLFVFLSLIYVMNKLLPSSFIPTEDQGTIYASVTLPAGSTVERTQTVMDELYNRVSKHGAVESVSTVAGYSIMTESAGSSYGMGMINLKPWDDRDVNVSEMIGLFNDSISGSLSEGSIQFFPPPAIPGFGNASGFEVRLQDKTGGSLLQTAEITTKFVNALNGCREIQNAFTTFDPNFPQFLLEIDYDKASKLGITVSDAMESLQALVGSYYTSNFVRFGQMYKVMIQTAPRFRSKPNDILQLYVKTDRGEMVSFSTFMKLHRTFGPEQITRYNMFTAALITGEPKKGYSSGDAIAAVEKVARETLPRGYAIEWSGVSREEVKSGNQAIIIFSICLLFVYLILAAQYESYLLPLAVILALPAGIFGSYFFIWMAGLENNIYAQVALIMLIGLLGKNAILIVEFARQRRTEGHDVLRAAKDAAMSRLRPILMTSFAFVAGLIPLCISSGAGAIGNRSIGITAAGGMIVGTLFGLIIVPGLYVLLESILRKRLRSSKPMEDI